MQITDVFRKNKAAAKEYKLIINQGGSSSGKTYSILQMLLLLMQKDKKGDVTSVVAESLPHLKKSALRDFIKIAEKSHELVKGWIFNKTELTYTTPKGALLEFFSADAAGKVHGPRRKRLFLNECNNIDYETYYQLSMRTSGRIFLDFNPVSEFWVQTEILSNPKIKSILIKSTYRDNQYCPASAIAAIEARKEKNPNWYKVYGLGETGTLEGLIFDTIHIISNIPAEYKHLGAGLDFGYTNDPTALISLYQSGENIIYDEEIYNTGLQNNQIANLIKQTKLGLLEIRADSSEPKSIDEIYHTGGINIKPAKKGPDSVKFGIDLIKQFNIYVTQRSINLIKEFRNYKWLVDKTGKALNQPEDCWNHGIDAARYISIAKLSKPAKEYDIEEV